MEGSVREAERLFCDEGYDPVEVVAIPSSEDGVVVQKCVIDFLFASRAEVRGDCTVTGNRRGATNALLKRGHEQNAGRYAHYRG